MNKGTILLPDADLIKELAKEFQKNEVQPDTLYVDGHIDLPFFMATHTPDRIFDDLDTGPVTPDTVKRSDVRLFNTAVYCQDIYNGERARMHFQNNLDYSKKILENVTHIRSDNDIRELRNSRDAIGTFFLLENADALTNNSSLIMTLRDQGIYIVGLTHKGTNRLADGNEVMHSDGITPEGREVVHVLLDNNILIDVAHLHPSCFWQLMDLVEGPCVSSHTGIRERCNIPRNLDVEQIRQIYDRNGLIGIAYDPKMLSPDAEADIEDIFIHLDTVVQKFGPDCVALGSDFCGYKKVTTGMEDLLGVNTLKGIMEGNGYSKEAVDKIMGINWLRIYEGLL